MRLTKSIEQVGAAGLYARDILARITDFCHDVRFM